MNIVFRADASINIGSGHIMRCLALADTLTKKGHQCRFICRSHKGNLGDFIIQKGYKVVFLSNSYQPDLMKTIETKAYDYQTITDKEMYHLGPSPYSHWLEVPWQLDAKQTLQSLSEQPADWLVLDHYALDYRWQSACKTGFNKLMVIDDLVNRQHLCDLLLDQTFSRKPQEYQVLVPNHCQILTGAQYALLRPEFNQWRALSLAKRQDPVLNNILVNLGGVDKDNVTGALLRAINASTLPESCTLTVVMGATAPHIEEIKTLAKEMKHPCQVLQGINNMAELMAHADFSIGAAGSTSWERCCLGLPTMMVILADNQRDIAYQLSRAGAAITLNLTDNLNIQIEQQLQLLTPARLAQLSLAAQAISQGLGCQLLTQKILELS